MSFKKLNSEFENFEPDIPIKGWEEIESHLPKSRQWWKWAAVFIAVVLVTGGSWMLLSDNTTCKKEAQPRPTKNKVLKGPEIKEPQTAKKEHDVPKDNLSETKNTSNSDIKPPPPSSSSSIDSVFDVQKLPQEQVVAINVVRPSSTVQDSTSIRLPGETHKIEGNFNIVLKTGSPAICVSDSVELYLYMSEPAEKTSYFIDHKEIKPINNKIQINVAGEHIISVQCLYQDSVYKSSQKIIVHPLPQASFSLDRDFSGFIPEVTATADEQNKEYQYKWIIDHQIISQEHSCNYSFHNSGIYKLQLIVTNPYGCSTSSEETIDVALSLKAPNAFSPNGDGINDTWMPLVLKNHPELKFQLKIIDQQGRQVFYTTNSANEWTGKIPGKNYEEIKGNIYIWYAIVFLPTGEKLNFGGSITIL